MRYLLDVNSLLALGVFEHEFHQRVASWFDRISQRAKPELATCSITELGFVRVLGQAQQYGLSVLQAREILAQLKASELAAWTFIDDDQDVFHLPKWVKTSKQTTDGHLVGLAKAHDSVLATLDRGIPGALVIRAKS
jgi:uncharacterized protein